jgi:hypothetical protein
MHHLNETEIDSLLTGITTNTALAGDSLLPENPRAAAK